MSKPKTPAAPDYVGAAVAQGEANLDAARQTQQMNMIDQYSPLGSMTYTPLGGDRYRSDITMTPEGQALYDREMRLSEATGQVGEDMLGRVKGAYDTPLDASGLPSVQAPTTAGMYQPNLGGIQGGYAERMAQIGRTQAPNTTGMRDINTPNTAGLTPYQTATNAGLPGVSRLSADGMQGVSIPGGNLPGVRGVDTAGMRDVSGLTDSGLPGTSRPDLAALSAVDNPDAAQRQRLADALLSRQERNLSRDEESLRTRLANQGIAQGSEAWNRDMQSIGEARNDARIQADLAAGQEMAQQFAMQQSLRGQQFGEQTALSDIDRATRGQQFGERAAVTDADMAMRGQQYEERMGLGQYDLARRGQQFGEQQGTSAAQLAARGQQFGERGAITDADQALRSQMMAEQLALSGEARANRGQQFGEQTALSDIDRAIRGQQFGEAESMYNMGRTSEQDAISRIAQQQQLESGFFGLGMDLRGQQMNEANQMYGLQSQERQRQLQEAAYLRGLPLSELNAMRTGSQVQMPQFQGTATPVNVGAAPMYNATADKYAAQLDAYNAKAGMFGNTMSGLFGLGSAAIMSDRRLKHDIQRIGQTVYGLGLYLFRYIWGGPIQMGVMAQEVAEVRPDCVVDIGGFMAVDYGRLYAYH
jgi:hypothetical protein